MKSSSVTITKKSSEQHFPVVLFIMLYSHVGLNVFLLFPGSGRNFLRFMFTHAIDIQDITVTFQVQCGQEGRAWIGCTASLE